MIACNVASLPWINASSDHWPCMSVFKSVSAVHDLFGHHHDGSSNPQPARTIQMQEISTCSSPGSGC
eukprot:12912030-Prorocentrum_lima.AAC.1